MIDFSGWRKKKIALDKKAENARELGLDYEPVATVISESGANVTHSWWHEPALPIGTKLYTSPQRTWVGLTEDEIVLISADCAATHQHTDIHFARAIEAKLKEKNT
jgi:hypothetical protein